MLENDGPTPSQVQQAQSNLSNLMDWTNHMHDYMQDVLNQVYDRLSESSAHDPGQAAPALTGTVGYSIVRAL